MKFQVIEAIAKLVTHISSGTPSSSVPGQFWYDSVADKFRGQKASSVVDLEGWSGSVTLKNITVNLTWGQVAERLVTVTDASVTATSKILLGHGSYSMTDQNEGETEVIQSIEPKNIVSGQFDIQVNARAPIVWPFKFTYLITS